MVVYYLADLTFIKDVLGGQINKQIRYTKAYVLFRYLLRICVIVDYILLKVDTCITVLIHIQKYIFFVCNQKRS